MINIFSVIVLKTKTLLLHLHKKGHFDNLCWSVQPVIFIYLFSETFTFLYPSVRSLGSWVPCCTTNYETHKKIGDLESELRLLLPLGLCGSPGLSVSWLLSDKRGRFPGPFLDGDVLSFTNLLPTR